MAATPLSDESDTADIPKTEILYAPEAILRRSIQELSNAKETVDSCCDEVAPRMILKVEALLRVTKESVARGVRHRYVTEITKKNLSDCRELMKIVQLRHMDGIKGNFNVSDRKLYAGGGGTDTADGKFPSQYIFSNIPAFVQQQQDFFDILWDKAIPAEQRIMQIEEGIEPEITEVVTGWDSIFKRSMDNFSRAKERIDTCADALIPPLIVDSPMLKASIEFVGRGGRIRLITEITTQNLSSVKELMKSHNIRHIDGFKLNFGVDDRIYFAPTSAFSLTSNPQCIFSNSKKVVREHQYLFNKLWEKAIPAEERIRQIEEQREPEFLEVITDSQRAAEKAIEFAKSVKQEALIMLPVAKTVIRLDKVGFWDHLIHAANNGARIRLMCPLTSANQSIIERISQLPSVSVLSSEPTTAGFFVLDEKRYLRAEVINSEADSLSDALDFLEYSNSKSGVLYFKTFFEVIWRQLQSYQTLRDLNKMQSEFISIAAHELKNPVQPILGLAQLLRDKASDQDRQLLDIIVRNAKKLVEIQDNILDVTRIENNNLRLRKEQTNLKEIIADVVQAHRSQASGTELVVHSSDVYVYADRNRIVQVISNLLTNAIKFTLAGTIVISLEQNSDHVVVLVKDSGIGLDTTVIPKLFTKFFTTSENGTGLGLFISKSIIEAHGGKIWAENSNDKGATFGFSLPLLQKSQLRSAE